MKDEKLLFNRKVLIVRFKFLPLSEPFNYDEIVYLKKYKPYIFCRHRLNKESFPYDLFCNCVLLKQHNYIWMILDDFFSTKSARCRDEEQQKKYLREFIGEHNISIVHAHFYEEILFCLDIRNNLEFFFVASLHGWLDIHKMKLLEKSRFEEMVKKVDIFIVKSAYMKSELIRLGVLPPKVVVFLRGVDLEIWRHHIVKVKSNSVTILFVGRGIPKKGILWLLKAFYQICQKRHNISNLILVALYPNFLERLFKFIVHLICCRRIESGCFYPEQVLFFIKLRGLSSHVKLINGLKHGQVKEIMNQADIVVVPSISGKTGAIEEGIPCVLIEAQALQKPVITTQHPGVAEGLIDKETGFLVKENDITDLEEKLALLIDDHKLRQSMGVKGRKFVEEKFDLNKNISILERIYAGT